MEEKVTQEKVKILYIMEFDDNGISVCMESIENPGNVYTIEYSGDDVFPDFKMGDEVYYTTITSQEVYLAEETAKGGKYDAQTRTVTKHTIELTERTRNSTGNTSYYPNASESNDDVVYYFGEINPQPKTSGTVDDEEENPIDDGIAPPKDDGISLDDSGIDM